MEDKLSVPFLESKGVHVSAPLKSWLARARFIANTRGGEAEKEKYVNWALCTVEQEADNLSVNWKKLSPIMPNGTPNKTPKMLMVSTAERDNGSQQETRRDSLLKSILGRSPLELKPFVSKAFSLYDADVKAGRRTYEQVSMVEMLNIARNLQKSELNKELKRTQELSSYPLKPQPVLMSGSPTSSYVESAKPVVYTQSGSLKTQTYTMNPQNRSADYAFFSSIVSCHTEGEEKAALRGKSTNMERNYSRYEPNEVDIRPLKVLRKSFAFIRAKCNEKIENGGDRKSALKYLSDQLKAMRQDIRVQNIENNFGVNVYETHARICLELGDIGEFNQCQSSLKQLYYSRGVKLEKTGARGFFCLRLIYLSLSNQYDSLSSELSSSVTHSDEKWKQLALPSPEVISRTLRLCAACEEGDVRDIALLLSKFPAEMGHLLRIYLQKSRVVWLRNLMSGIRGKVTPGILLRYLGSTPVVVFTDGKESLTWLDGSPEAAEREFKALCSTLKLEVRSTGSAEDPPLDAGDILTCVTTYLNYLSTRKDVTLGKGEPLS